mmetsp:Transcript_1401/g.5132  ORF Transcript_1401/g.5132 Transcript_1401/m.5132 type:complete len:99 (+) Transcript_1401:2396-2692(+)
MSIPTFFNRIIKEVTNGVKVDFSTEQLSEAHLQKLATLWEQKLLALDSVRTNLIAGDGETSEERQNTLLANEDKVNGALNVDIITCDMLLTLSDSSVP